MSTSAERSAHARAAALAMHSQGKTNTQPARTAFFARFERQVDPDGTLTPEERQKRADQAMRSYFSSLAVKSARVRRARRVGAAGREAAA